MCSDPLGLYVVADGMGGHLGGQTASRLAVQTLEAALSTPAPGAEDIAGASGSYSSLPRRLAGALRQACAAVFDRAQADRSLHGMGTTCTALWICAGRAVVAHVGDSRCYLLRQRQLTQITDDHSLVNEQIKAGLLSPEQARSSRLKNIITRSVGFERDVAVDTFAMPLQPGDFFLVCSDGLTNMVEEEELASCLQQGPLTAVPQALIDQANGRGGDDNISVVCVQVGADPSPP